MKNIKESLKDKKEFFFQGKTDKNPLTYTINEKMIFTLTFFADGEAVSLPYAKVSVEGDDGRKDSFFLVPDKDGVFTFETSLSRDGYLRVVASPCDEEKNVIEDMPLFEGGGGADIDRIKCETDEPDDYFDTAIAAKHLKCPVYIEAGLGDYTCPPSGITALYNKVESPKKIDFIQGRTHSYIPLVKDVFTLEKE